MLIDVLEHPFSLPILIVLLPGLKFKTQINFNVHARDPRTILNPQTVLSPFGVFEPV